MLTGEDLRIATSQGWVVGVDGEGAAVVPFEVAVRMGDPSGAVTASGPVAPDVAESFRVALWAAGLALECPQPVAAHLHFPNRGLNGRGPSCAGALALALLAAMGAPLRHEPAGCAVLASLTLRGDLLPVGHVVAKAAAARAHGLEHVVVSAHQHEAVAGALVLHDLRALLSP